jgi:hypothetical protein
MLPPSAASPLRRGLSQAATGGRVQKPCHGKSYQQNKGLSSTSGLLGRAENAAAPLDWAKFSAAGELRKYPLTIAT